MCSSLNLCIEGHDYNLDFVTEREKLLDICPKYTGDHGPEFTNLREENTNQPTKTKTCLVAQPAKGKRGKMKPKGRNTTIPGPGQLPSETKPKGLSLTLKGQFGRVLLKRRSSNYSTGNKAGDAEHSVQV